MAMGSDFPVPVTDEQNVLVGEVHRSALAEALAETAAADPDYEANAAENAALAAEAGMNGEEGDSSSHNQ
jgi:hypothetical protein